MLTEEKAAVEIAKILTGNDDFEWDWKEEKPVGRGNQKPSIAESGRWRCKGCDWEGSLEEAKDLFHKDSGSPSGLKYTCKECSKEYGAEFYRKKRGDKKPIKEPPVSNSSNKSVFVDMSDLPGLYDALTRVARDQERTPAGQVRWWIRQMLKEGVKHEADLDHTDDPADVQVS